MEYNVKCSKCNKGNLLSPNGYSYIDDYYEIHCTNCTHVFTTHYTGMDNILDEHNYNSQVCKDVRMLNENGSWVCQEQSINIEELDKYSKGMRLIQKIESEFDRYYFQKGGEFYSISVMPHGCTFDFCKYEAKSDQAIQNLINHFFTKA